jgi:hypothetical protein
MNGRALFEDIDEEIDEADDEEIDEAFREDDESLAERRRRRRRRRRAGGNVRGRGYNQPRLEKSYVTQTQLEAVSKRIGEDIRKLASSTSSLDTRIEAAATKNKSIGQNLQMAMLLPLLTAPPTITVDAKGTLPPQTQVLSGKQDSLTALLPLLLMGGMGGMGGTGGTDSAGTSSDQMMLPMVLLLATQGKKP